MVDINLSAKVPALEKLIDYTASGIGAVAGSMLTVWRARQEAEARRVTAESEADSLRIIADAQAAARRSLIAPGELGSGAVEVGADGGIQQRIEFQERKRQANIVSVVEEAAEALDGKEAPDHKPDPDWTARFFDCVQDVSSEDMQGIWARILAGEVESPGRTSLRTLDVLKNITKEEADLFASVSDFVIGDVIFNPEEFQGNHPILSFYSVIRLQNVGLLYHASLLERTMKLYENQRYLEYQDRLLKIHGSPNEKEISIPIILLTDPGKQLYRIMECDASHDYLKSLSEFLSKQNCELSYTRIIDRLADGRIKHDNQFVTVPPEALKHSETGT